MSFSTPLSRRGGWFAVALLTVAAFAPQVVGAQGETASRRLSRLSAVKSGGRKQINKSALADAALPDRFTSKLRPGAEGSPQILEAVTTLKGLANGTEAAPGSAMSRRLAAKLDALTTRLRLGNDAPSAKSTLKMRLDSDASNMKRLTSQLKEGGTAHNDLGETLRNLKR